MTNPSPVQRYNVNGADLFPALDSGHTYVVVLATDHMAHYDALQQALALAEKDRDEWKESSRVWQEQATTYHLERDAAREALALAEGRCGEMERERDALRVEATTARLALALWMNGDTPNQPLIDDIERWRQEITDGVYSSELSAERDALARRVGELTALLIEIQYDTVTFGSPLQETRLKLGNVLSAPSESDGGGNERA